MHSSWETIIVISIFAFCYLYFTARETAKNKLDLYDLVMLSAVAIIPWGFVLFPRIAEWISKTAGVAFPFVIMFGILFVILFTFIHRLTVKIHQIERNERTLIQEMSLLKSEINDLKKKSPKDLKESDSEQ